MSDIQYPLVWVAAAAVSFLLLRAYVKSKQYPRHLPLPPGPKPKPILGNALDIPLSKQWLTFQRWAAEYGTRSRHYTRVHLTHATPPGDIFHISLLGQPVIVLSGIDTAKDLLDKRSAKYSDRLDSTVASM